MENYNPPFYHIILKKKGQIEIFTNVFSHEIFIDRDKAPYAIEIKYSSTQNLGNFTCSQRPMKEIYEVQVNDTAKYEPSGPFPQDTKVIIH